MYNSEESQESRRDAEGKCMSAIATTSLLNALAFGLTNDGNAPDLLLLYLRHLSDRNNQSIQYNYIVLVDKLNFAFNISCEF